MSERPYKRIFQCAPEMVDDLQSHSGFAGILIRPARGADSEHEWVAEGPFHERGRIDKIARLFDQRA